MTRQRVSVRVAAQELGISEDAVRMRVKRGTLPAEREGNRLYVLLEERPDAVGSNESNALISELRNRIAYLEGIVETRDEEIRRRDSIIMNMTETMKALNPPRLEEDTAEATEVPQQDAEEAGVGRGVATPPLQQAPSRSSRRGRF
jgi:hypothetical protein